MADDVRPLRDRPLRDRKLDLLAQEAATGRAPPPSPQTVATLKRLGLSEHQALLGAPRTCGARTRRGTACAALALLNGRCRNHGGKSTGPRTPEGWARVHAGRAAYWARRRAEETAPPD